MTNEAEEKPGGEAQGHDDEPDSSEDRPTVTPPFDPVELAQTIVGGRPSPATGSPVTKPAPGGVPPAARSTPLGLGRPQMPTLTDPIELELARQESAVSRPGPSRPPPQGLLSLANARVPSNIPPRREGLDSLSPDLDPEREEMATSPPPALQQALIDAMSGDDAPSTRNAPEVSAAAAAQPAAKRQAPPPSGPPTAQEMNDRMALGDYSGALEIAEGLLAIAPDDEPARACAESCRSTLKKMYTARIGPLGRVPSVMVSRDQLRWLSIDHRAGFVLSLVDGVSSVEMILDVCGMPELDALRILSELGQERIISFR